MAEGRKPILLDASHLSNTADTLRNSGARVDGSASKIMVWTLSEGERKEPSAYSQ